MLYSTALCPRSSPPSYYLSKYHSMQSKICPNWFPNAFPSHHLHPSPTGRWDRWQEFRFLRCSGIYYNDGWGEHNFLWIYTAVLRIHRYYGRSQGVADVYITGYGFWRNNRIRGLVWQEIAAPDPLKQIEWFPRRPVFLLLFLCFLIDYCALPPYLASLLSFQAVHLYMHICVSLVLPLARKPLWWQKNNIVF